MYPIFRSHVLAGSSFILGAHVLSETLFYVWRSCVIGNFVFYVWSSCVIRNIVLCLEVLCYLKLCFMFGGLVL
jgi:hypothetical protein